MLEIIDNKEISFNTVIGNAEEFDIHCRQGKMKTKKDNILSLALKFSRSVK